MDKNSVVGLLLRNKMQFVLDCVEASLAAYNPKSGFKKTRLFLITSGTLICYWKLEFSCAKVCT